MIFLFLLGCLAPLGPAWAPPPEVSAACAGKAALPAVEPPTSIHVWTEAESQQELGLRPEAMGGRLLVELVLKVPPAPLASVQPTLHLVAGASDWGRCAECNPQWLARAAGETSLVPAPPVAKGEDKPRSSKAPFRPPKPKGLVGGLAMLIAFPVMLVVGAGIGAAEALSSLSPEKPEMTTVYGGPKTDRLLALSRPPACTSRSGADCRMGGILERSGPRDPIRYSQDAIYLVWSVSDKSGCTRKVQWRQPLPPGPTLADRINGLDLRPRAPPIKGKKGGKK